MIPTDKPKRVIVVNNLAFQICSWAPQPGFYGQYNWIRPAGTRPLSNFPGGVTGSGGDPKNS